MIEHVSGTLGTPKRPGKSIETYVFAVFNENQKPPGTEQNFGLYYPTMTEVYHVEFNLLTLNLMLFLFLFPLTNGAKQSNYPKKFRRLIVDSKLILTNANLNTEDRALSNTS